MTAAVQAKLVQFEMPCGQKIKRLGSSLIQATDHWLTVDVFQPRGAPQRLVEVPLDQVTGLNIEGQPDHARGFGTAGALTFGLVGGFLGAGKRVQGATRFVISTTTGWMLFETGLPAPVIDNALAPLRLKFA